MTLKYKFHIKRVLFLTKKRITVYERGKLITVSIIYLVFWADVEATVVVIAEVVDSGGGGDDDCGGNGVVTTGLLVLLLLLTADGMSLPDVDFTNSSAVKIFKISVDVHS